MYSQRIISRFARSHCSPSLRSLSSTARQQRAPALSDIIPNQAASFDAKQKAFRDDLSEKARKQKEQERMKSKAARPQAESSSSLYPSAMAGQGLGSLSTHTGAAARKKDEADSGKKPGSGRLSSLIYGTEEGREMDREIERSFSQVLARGKYVHSIVFHQVKPDKVNEYVDVVGAWYPRMASMPENKVNLVGSWRTEVGDCDTFGELATRRATWPCSHLTRTSAHLGIPAL